MKKILMSEFTITANDQSMDDIKEMFIDEHLPLLLANEIELVRDLDHHMLQTWTVNLEDIYNDAIVESHVVKDLMAWNMSELGKEVKKQATEALEEWFDDATS